MDRSQIRLLLQIDIEMVIDCDDRTSAECYTHTLAYQIEIEPKCLGLTEFAEINMRENVYSFSFPLFRLYNRRPGDENEIGSSDLIRRLDLLNK